MDKQKYDKRLCWTNKLALSLRASVWVWSKKKLLKKCTKCVLFCEKWRGESKWKAKIKIWRLELKSNRKVTLKFQSLRLECFRRCTYVRIYANITSLLQINLVLSANKTSNWRHSLSDRWTSNKLLYLMYLLYYVWIDCVFDKYIFNIFFPCYSLSTFYSMIFVLSLNYDNNF